MHIGTDTVSMFLANFVVINRNVFSPALLNTDRKLLKDYVFYLVGGGAKTDIIRIKRHYYPCKEPYTSGTRGWIVLITFLL